MKIKTKISIVMPNYNSAEFLMSTVKSIKEQSYKNWELIIVDDNSNIETKKILKKLNKQKKIKIFFLKKNRGDGFCRLYGVKKSKSDLIAFIDSDDIWKKNKLKLQYNFMMKKKIEFTYSYFTPFKNQMNYFKQVLTPGKYNFSSFIFNTSIATSSMIVRKRLLKNIKLCKSPNFEDYYLKCQILKKIEFAYCYKKSLLNYRIKKNSLSKNKIRNIFWLWKINRNFNNLSIVKSIFSLLFISLNSVKKYGLK